jgi:hypothetical protein
MLKYEEGFMLLSLSAIDTIIYLYIRSYIIRGHWRVSLLL